jgi:hypothetical protein
MPPRSRQPDGQQGPGEAARLAERLIDALGCTKADIARIIGRDRSLVSQFWTKGKGAAYVDGMRQALEAVRVGGVTDIETLGEIASRNITRRRTKHGNRSRVRKGAVISTTHGSGSGRVGAQAITTGATALRPLIKRAAQKGHRMAFTVRMLRRDFNLDAGDPDDSPGQRRGVVIRSDATEERSYGSKTTGGVDAADFARRVDAADGDVAKAIRQWLVETGRIHRFSAPIVEMEIRTWNPR